MAKTDWTTKDAVKPEDMNQIGREINDNSNDLAAHLADYAQKIKSINKGRCLLQSNVNTLVPGTTAKVIDLSASIVNETFYDWNGSTNRLTFKKTGLYLFNCAVLFLDPQGETGKTIYFIPRIDGGSIYGDFFPKLIVNGGSSISLSGAAFLDVSVGASMYVNVEYTFTQAVNVKGKIEIMNLTEV